MAYLNEFPKWDSNGRNLDWLLEQYSTFEKRLQEIRDAFTETVTRLEGDIDTLENTYQRELDLFEGRINTLVNEITRKVDSINENVGGYVNEYLTENINTILVDNPVLETKYERVGTISANSSFTYEIETNAMYEIMILDYAFNYKKWLVSNDTYNVIGRTFTYVGTTLTYDGTEHSCTVPIMSQFDFNTNILSIVNNVVTINNGTSNVLTVYVKKLI